MHHQEHRHIHTSDPEQNIRSKWGPSTN